MIQCSVRVEIMPHFVSFPFNDGFNRYIATLYICPVWLYMLIHLSIYNHHPFFFIFHRILESCNPVYSLLCEENITMLY